jgi:hypothetical protein
MYAEACLEYVYVNAQLTYMHVLYYVNSLLFRHFFVFYTGTLFRLKDLEPI